MYALNAQQAPYRTCRRCHHVIIMARKRIIAYHTTVLAEFGNDQQILQTHDSIPFQLWVCLIFAAFFQASTYIDLTKTIRVLRKDTPRYDTRYYHQNTTLFEIAQHMD